MKQAGGEPFELVTDVAKADEVFAAAEAVIARWGRIHVWVNDAMETVVGPVDSIAPEEFRRVTEVTYLGVVHGTLAALRHMRPRDEGHIVQIGSALAYRAIPLQSAYCAAKFAIRGFTNSLRAELIHDGSGIGLTMAQLPGVNTPQFDWSHMHLAYRHQPIGTVYEPEAIPKRSSEPYTLGARHANCGSARRPSSRSSAPWLRRGCSTATSRAMRPKTNILAIQCVRAIPMSFSDRTIATRRAWPIFLAGEGSRRCGRSSLSARRRCLRRIGACRWRPPMGRFATRQRCGIAQQE